MPDVTSAPASRPSRRPSPVLHGVARSSSASAWGVMCFRTSARSAWKPPVASTTGMVSGSSRSGAERRTSPTTRVMASISERVEKRAPTVAGLPVERSTTRAPWPLQPGNVVVQPVVDEPLQLRRASRALATKLLEVAIAPHHTAREPHRSARLVSLFERAERRRRVPSPPRQPRDRPCRRRLRRGRASLRRARSPACARRTRA